MLALACGGLLTLLLASQAEEGALAPAGAWVTHGGSPARTRAAATRALRGVPHRAWSFEAPGPIEGDPLVWANCVVVSHRLEQGRGIALLDLRDGALLGELTFPEAELPLAPCLWDDLLLVRAGGLSAYRVGVRGIRSRWTKLADERYGPPLLYRDEIYVVDGDQLVRLDATSAQEVWRDEGRHHGRPSLRGDRVYVPGSDGEFATIDAVSRADGRHVSSQQPVATPGGLPAGTDPGSAFVSVMSEHRILYLEHGIDWRPDQPTRSLVVTAGSTEPEQALPAHWLYQRVEAAEVPQGWLGSTQNEEGGLWFLARAENYVPLASASSHPELAGRRDAPSRSGNVAYLAGSAVELGSHVVLWRLPGEALVTIPASEAVLVQRDERRLEAWRTHDPVGSSHLAYGTGELTKESARVDDARVVFADGAIDTGDFQLAERRGEPTLVKLRRTGSDRDLTRQVLRSLDDTLLVLDADDSVVYAAGPTALLRGAEALIAQRLGADYAALAVESLPARDYALLERIVTRARELGVEEQELARAVRQLERHAEEGASRREPDKARAVEARLVQLESAREDRLVGMAAALPPDEHDLCYELLLAGLLEAPGHSAGHDQLAQLPALLRIALLREVEQARPGTTAVAEAVRALLPAGLTPPEPFATLEWLAFLEALERAPVTLLDPRPDSADLGPAERKLGSAALHWRSDLKGFESDNLFVITPISRPGAIARCLALGELVCEALDEIFAGGENRRDLRYPLTILLFESKEEYLEQSAQKGGHLDLGWTAGHYDELDNVSRLFLPAGDEDFDNVTRTLVHELTHQWVRNRCPLFTNEEAVRARQRPAPRGYWIVEGFASLIEDFQFDTAAWSWSPENANSRRRDVATSAAAEQLVPWDALFTVDAVAFFGLGREHALEIPLKTRLGRLQKASALSLFYAQAQSACYYLFSGENGRHRPALLAYLAAYYRGADSDLGVDTEFGATAEELGTRALEFGRESLR